MCLAAALLFPAASLRAATPAGTAIRNSAAGQYHVGATTWSMTSNEVVTTVALAPAVRLTPTSASGSAPAGSTYYFAHTVTNDANGSDTIALSATSDRGWPIILYLDDNADGLHQSGERTAVTSTGALAAGASFRFFLAATVPNGPSVGTVSVVTLVAASQSGGASQQAQDTLTCSGAGSIDGVVNWAGRAPAVGIDVAALDGATTVASTQTSSSGTFQLTGLPSGTYTVQISGQGTVPQGCTGVAVEGRDTVSCDFTAVAQPQFAAGLQMVTVPLTYANGDPAAVTGVSSGLQLASWSPGLTRYLVYGVDSGFPGFAPSRGFWLQANGSGPSLVEHGVLAPQGQEAAIPLSAGWNIIGSPLVSAFTWANCQVRRSGQTVDLATAGTNGWIRPYLWGYDPAAGQYALVHATYPDADRTVEPWKGYWLRALVDCELVISPAAAERPAAPAADVPFRPSANNWRVRLVASAGSKEDGFNVLGVASDAAANDPTYRLASPPPVSQSVDLAFASSAAADDSGLATDIRTPAPGKMAWTFRVRTDLSGTPVTVTWPDLSQVPAQYRVTLVDLDGNHRQYMRTTTGYVFNAGAKGGERRFQIEFDPTPWARLQVAGLRQMAPPAQGVSVSFTLSADAVVTAQVRTLSGRAVRLLCANQARSAGTQLLSWDGRDASGRAMSAGPYLCEISAVTDEGQAVKGMRTIILTR